jgi:uncharacterized membrane protein YjjB (DUF3815 family)
MFKHIFPLRGSKLLYEMFHGDGLMSLVRLIFANTANNCLVFALIFNAESREWLVGMSFDVAGRVYDFVSAH